jgi:peptidoglycan/LPS O-acetylase OafA/YrhL
VDFFFVLSGFVITASYRTKFLAGFSFWRFMLLRLGRLYPLHIVILGAFIGIEIVRYRFGGLLGGDIEGKFSGPHSIEAIITNILLIQSLGIHHTLTWNLPAWSISVEFYTYAIFAIALLFLRHRIYIFIAIVIIVTPIVLLRFVSHIDTDYDFGVVRCALGFFTGFICYDLYLLIKQEGQTHGNISGTINLIEISCVGLVISFVSFCGNGPLSIAAPLIFALTVLIFSFERGIVSKILKMKSLLFLGALSYSIYMVHTLVLILMSYGVRLAERKWGVVLSTRGYFGAEMWQGDLSYGILICLILGASYLTYNFIEAPGRRQTRRIADRIFVATTPSTSASARSVHTEKLRLVDESDTRRETAQGVVRP